MKRVVAAVVAFLLLVNIGALVFLAWREYDGHGSFAIRFDIPIRHTEITTVVPSTTERADARAAVEDWCASSSYGSCKSIVYMGSAPETNAFRGIEVYLLVVPSTDAAGDPEDGFLIRRVGIEDGQVLGVR